MFCFCFFQWMNLGQDKGPVWDKQGLFWDVNQERGTQRKQREQPSYLSVNLSYFIPHTSLLSFSMFTAQWNILSVSEGKLSQSVQHISCHVSSQPGVVRVCDTCLQIQNVNITFTLLPEVVWHRNVISFITSCSSSLYCQMWYLAALVMHLTVCKTFGFIHYRFLFNASRKLTKKVQQQSEYRHQSLWLVPLRSVRWHEFSKWPQIFTSMSITTEFQSPDQFDLVLFI